jgi:hypothetical protein
LAPGARFVAAITATFTVAGQVSSFNRNAFQNALATLMSVLPSAITLDISAGSVVVQTTITYPSSAAAITAVVTLAAKNTTTLSTALGVIVEAVANVAQTVIIVHASPPPPPPSPSPLCVAESATAGNVSMTSAIIFVAIGAIIGAALTMIVWAVLPYGKMRARRVEPVRTAQPAMPVRTAQPAMPVRTAQPAMPARTAQPAMPVRESRQRV